MWAWRRIGSECDTILLHTLNELCDVEMIIHTGPDFLSAAESRKLLQSMDNVMLGYNWLMKDALDRDLLRFGFTVKLHFLWHTCHLARFQNPRLIWCYPFEDYMGKVVQSAQGSIAGTAAPLMGNKVMSNFRLVLHLQLFLAKRKLEQEASH